MSGHIKRFILKEVSLVRVTCDDKSNASSSLSRVEWSKALLWPGPGFCALHITTELLCVHTQPSPAIATLTRYYRTTHTEIHYIH